MTEQERIAFEKEVREKVAEEQRAKQRAYKAVWREKNRENIRQYNKDWRMRRKSKEEVKHNSRKAWEDGKISPNRTDSYFGIWREMNRCRQFFETERKDYDVRFKKFEEIYNAQVVAQHKGRFKDDFSKTTSVAIAAYRKMINEFTDKKHEQVTKMVRTAPSESMRNLLETLKLRDDLDAVELQDIMPVFYENYHAIRALQTIGRLNGIHIYVPVQMDCAAMHRMIDEVREYLLGACNVMFKPKAVIMKL